MGVGGWVGWAEKEFQPEGNNIAKAERHGGWGKQLCIPEVEVSAGAERFQGERGRAQITEVLFSI